MPKAGLSTDRVVEIALELAAAGGPVTLGTVAAHAGVKTPSLYKHVTSAADLDSRVAERVLLQLTDYLETAIGSRTGTAAAAATLNGYRDFAAAQPPVYALLPIQPGNDPRLRPHAQHLMNRIATAIGYTDTHSQAALDALRLIRSASEGFIQLENAGGFGEPADVQTSWDHLVTIISTAAAP